MRNRSSIGIRQYWERIRGENTAPMRRDVDPGAIRAILPDLFILEQEQDGAIRFRLAGTRICACFGRELRGSSFTDLWRARQRKEVEGQLRAVMHNEVPMAAKISGTTWSGHPVSMEVTLLPMRSNGAHSDRIIGSLSTAIPLKDLEIEPLVTLAGIFFRWSDEGGSPTASDDMHPIKDAVVVGVSSSTAGPTPGKPILFKMLNGGRTQP